MAPFYKKKLTSLLMQPLGGAPNIYVTSALHAHPQSILILQKHFDIDADIDASCIFLFPSLQPC
jgi:hypothetical protein